MMILCLQFIITLILKVHMFVSPEKNGSEEENSDKNEEGVRERISID